ncbi:ABC transporter permease [Mycoplasmopsis caviae]|uniref:ABC transporter permease n=1 Tax=Mycoplasmopsis caviae TaxID=55603 RepID=A0A3P8MF96_9BACT|nr:ABC transporter permease [Mycoplasmopsis caviae]UUD35130.1 ABC transporter permease [Mycoplasmopsis caviae]VDR42053.1 ABC-type uncharacterized transport system, permease component [Mycoplasmopsis caviae]
MMDILETSIQNVFFYAIVLGLAATAGLFSERAGIVNIGIEGTMAMGALGYAAVGKSFGETETPYLQFVLLIGAVIGGLLFSLIHGFATIILKSEHTISGVALNILAVGVASVFCSKEVLGDAQQLVSFNVQELSLAPTGFKNIISLKLFIFIGIMVLAFVMLKYSKWGLRFKAVGENPQAVDVAGINVYSYKWQGIVISGILAGLAGGIFVQSTRGFNGSVSGLGFLALAIMIMGHWNVLYVFICSFIFSIFYYMAVLAKDAPAFKTFSEGFFKKDLTNYGALFGMVPFVFTLISLVAFSKLSPGPAAAGVNYDKSKR